MNINNIHISENQRLSDVIKEIPSNAILNKVLTGIGATHLELITERNSIIIEPNRPVIEGKRKEHKKILGVIEGIYTSDIEAYLMNDNILFKKIMTTPESFGKVKLAMENLGINMHEDYFLMFDECDRTAHDIDFRENITLPMDDFFLFKNKAFVSATAVKPSDPRFRKQGFEIYQIQPDFEYSKTLDLIVTNNPPYSLQNHFNESVSVKDDEKIFIFLNSTKGIISLIELGNLHSQCAVFCSETSAKKIGKRKDIDIHASIDESKFKKFNFLTSRFYSAVDINISEKPHIVVITDHKLAKHTMVDPYSDLIQISGRFRDIELASFTFISTYDDSLTGFSKTEAIKYLKCHKEIHRYIESLKDISQDTESARAYNDALTRTPYSDFLTEDGKTNYFRIDNFIMKEGLKLNYNGENILYQNLTSDKLKKRLNVNYKPMFFNHSSFYPNISGGATSREEIEERLDTLDNIFTDNEFQFGINISESVLKEFEKNFPILLEAYKKLGREKILNGGFSDRKLKHAILEYDQSIGITNNHIFLDELYLTLTVDSFYPEKYIKETFQKLVEKYDLPYKNKSKYMNDFKRFFEISNRTSRKGYKGKGYVLLRKKFK
ncbi:hypothetical protein [Sphingobacterium faecale]|uniref:Uncharacterized protein n=1 Tax=Sphingobacterium faecale TaxID=2803775 RepID=A0ABS1R5K3_9SPHI|nr:hypothetical protein [Sphingobacterium faecale]MBL1409570.1 hypothetical protein [Sphingobacterium faecale]